MFFGKDQHFERKVISPLNVIYIQIPEICGFKTGTLKFKDNLRKNATIQFLCKSVLKNDIHFCKYFFNDLIMQLRSEQILSEKIYSKDVSKFLEYVNKHYKEHISVKDFSHSIFMSHTGFLLKFKREVGVPPSDYITSFRLKTAAELLLNTHYTISEIASLSGYENVYYFSNAFKNHFSVSPGQYRKISL